MLNSFKHALKTLALGAFLLLQIMGTSAGTAMAYGWGWEIKDFNSTIQINKDSTINVTEHIVADFTQEEHHGIFRDIPVKYKDTNGMESQIPIEVQSVTDDSGKALTYTVSDEGDYIEIKIGDADILLNDVESYNISYKAERALTNYEDHDELYWNSTGDQWAVPMEKAGATIKFPEAVDVKKLKSTCYTGAHGSTAHDCSSKIIDEKTIQYSAAPSTSGEPALNPYEGLTIVAGYPSGIIQPTPPSPEQIFAKAPWYVKIYLFFFLNWGLLIPVAIGALMGFFWYTKGRDPETGKTTIMPIYAPPDNLKPTEVGTIIDESVDIRDITASIIDLAVRGYLKIIETKDKALFFNITKYTFKLLKKDYPEDKTLAAFEKKILDAVFEGDEEKDLTDLQNNFYKDLKEIQKDIYAGLVDKGYFPADPDKIRKMYLGIGLALILFPLTFIGGLILFMPWSLIVGLILSGLVIIIFGRYMPARTLKGAETRYKILGLEEFIKTAEADRLKFQEKENIFEKLLPYAMTLGIAEKWTKAFEGIYKTPPSWYSSNDPNFIHSFNTYYFLHSMTALSASMGTTFQSAPRSSGSGFGGGGFSGGGGGGGGGGAW